MNKNNNKGKLSTILDLFARSIERYSSTDRIKVADQTPESKKARRQTRQALALYTGVFSSDYPAVILAGSSRLSEPSNSISLRLSALIAASIVLVC